MTTTTTTTMELVGSQRLRRRLCSRVVLVMVVASLTASINSFVDGSNTRGGGGEHRRRLRGGQSSKPSAKQLYGFDNKDNEQPQGFWKRSVNFMKKPRVWIGIGLMYLLLRPLPVATEEEEAAFTSIELPYSTFLQALDMDNRTHPAVSDLEISQERYRFNLHGIPAETTPISIPSDLEKKLLDRGITFGAMEDELSTPMAIANILLNGALCVAVWMLNNGGLSQNLFSGEMNKVGERLEKFNRTTFNDLKGMSGPKREVSEIVDMLRHPKKYVDMGVRLPSGVLLVGPPGTGKTMLARAVAGEARVPFFATSGADFVEVFAGRGAARVRSLFKKAVKSAPSVIFIDELDALGKKRSSVRLGGTDEAEQTLNMLLAAMDGLTTKSNGVIVLAATNRLDVLDSALIRPGRFDRIVRVPLPERDGREKILRHHARHLRLGTDVSFRSIAERTEGLAGADLELIVNEAAVRAVRRNSKLTESVDFEDSIKHYFNGRKRSSGVGSLSSSSVSSSAAAAAPLARLFGNNDDDTTAAAAGNQKEMSMEEAVAAIERAAYQNGVTDVLQSLARQEFQQQLKDSTGKKNSEKRSMLGTVLENMQSMFGAAHQAQQSFQPSRISDKSRSSEYDKKAPSTKDHVHGDENNGGV